MACESRVFYSNIPTDHQCDSKERLLALGYRCQKDGVGIRIELPLLLPKRGADVSFITEPLHELLSLEEQVSRFQACTVIFQHIYGVSKGIQDIRDHDNLETRSILNVLERYFLTSDSGYYCANFHITQQASQNKTVITILSGKPDLLEIRKAVRA